MLVIMKNHMGSPSEPLPADETDHAADADSVSDPEERIMGELLQQMVRVTATKTAVLASGKLGQRLVAVASGFPEDADCTSAAVEALVAAVTVDIPFLDDAQRTSLNKAVSASLYGDVDTRTRVQTLWTSLRQTT
jgi:hypothetical protein